MNNKICLILDSSSPCLVSKMGQIKKPKAHYYIALLSSWFIFSFAFWTEELNDCKEKIASEIFWPLPGKPASLLL